MAAGPAAEVQASQDGCVEENHASIRLRVDAPASGAEVAVDEHGLISISGILHKHATMVEVSDGQVTASEFELGPPPEGVAAWAASWSTSLRPPELGQNEVCARAERDPKRAAKVLRSFTVVDLIPPGNVPDLAVSNITASSATVTWGAATDNYGLAGYEVTVDGGPPQRTSVGTRSFTITGLAPSTSHTVSVVAVDLAGNTSPTPATVSFTTDAPPPPPTGDLRLVPEQGGATAVWDPELPTDVTYRAFLDDALVEEFPPERYCQDDTGNPVSPCTAQRVISYPIEPLEEETPYTFRVDALRADGTLARSLSGSFTTTSSVDVVPPATTQLVVTEGSQCAGQGGDFYVAPDARASVPVPEGSTQLFSGCYTVEDNSCIDEILPASEDQKIDCEDDLTDLIFDVAPPGRGPVISSLDDVPTGVPGQTIHINPVSWCVFENACTLMFAPPPVLVPVVVSAPAAGVGIAILIVAGAAIAIGVALAGLIAFLFPSELFVGGVTEYPIDFTTDFDTFDNWGLTKGEWYNSLKVYAEVIETTNQIAERHDIPFAWTEPDDQDVQRKVDDACAIQQGDLFSGCGVDFAVYVPGGVNYQFRPMNQTGRHIATAIDPITGGDLTGTAKWLYPARSVGGRAAQNAGFRRDWFETQFQPNACTGRPAGQACDEFPFWTTNQAVNLSGILASLQPVPGAESLPQASDLSGFYTQCQVQDRDRFMVLPVESWVAAGGPSFGFRVGPGGASLCLVPRPPSGP